MQDIQELRKSMFKAIDFFNANRNTSGKADEIAEAIINATIRYIGEGTISQNDFVFSYKEIYEMVWGPVETSEKASRIVRAHKERLAELFGEDSELNMFLKANQLSELTLNIQSSLGGRKTILSIVNVNGLLKTDIEKNNGLAKYYVTMLPKPYLWTRPFISMALRPVPTISIFIIILLITVIAFYGLFKYSSETNTFVMLLLAFIIVISRQSYLKLSELLNKGLTEIPSFMVPIRFTNAFFILQRTTKEEGAKRESIAVVIEGKCGVCGDILIIGKSKEFKGRFIGRCGISSSEHIFSFDHVTKTGKNLRD